MAKKLIDKVNDIDGVIDRIIVIKVLVKRIIVSLISNLTVYSPQCGLDDSQKGDFYDSLINFVRKLGEKEILVIVADLIVADLAKTQVGYISVRTNQREI